jgi:hypothetical protein
MKPLFTLLMLGLLSSTALAAAPGPNGIAFVAVPSLEDAGVVGLALVVAIVGAIAVRRRKK